MYEEGFRVTVNGQTDMTDKPAYREGETVRIKIPPAMDVNIRVTCDDAEVRYSGLADGFLAYEFEMPARDCDVRVSMVNSMNRPPKAGLGSLFKKRKKNAPERAERKKDRYRATVNGRPAWTEKPSYAEGETVRIRIPLAQDARTEVTCDAAELRRADSDGWEAVYEFKMPAGGADIRVRVTSDMVAMPVPPVVEKPVPEGEGPACPECGLRFKGQPPKFCPECGTRLG